MLSISEINEYRESKGRDPIQLHKLPKDSAAEQLQELDHATIDMLNHGGPEQLVDDLFQQIVDDPSNTWTQQSLWYRQLQTHYKWTLVQQAQFKTSLTLRPVTNQVLVNESVLNLNQI